MQILNDLLNFAERFDIHSSTIIRTEESKAMGAQFLNDYDVASAGACLKMCCETSECDVFIFEEKVNKYLHFTAAKDNEKLTGHSE